MKDLESAEQRAMERKMLETAREQKRTGRNDYTHIAIAINLFIVAAILYAFGYSGAAAFVVLGLVVEMCAWAFLMERSRSTSEAKDSQAPGDGDK